MKFVWFTKSNGKPVAINPNGSALFSALTTIPQNR